MRRYTVIWKAWASGVVSRARIGSKHITDGSPRLRRARARSGQSPRRTDRRPRRGPLRAQRLASAVDLPLGGAVVDGGAAVAEAHRAGELRRDRDRAGAIDREPVTRNTV